MTALKLLDVRSARLTAEQMLSFDDVTVSYSAGGVEAVAELTLTIDAGERVALIGPSGAGKSTILRLAAGLASPTSGSVKVFGVDSGQLGRRNHRPERSRIGIISQDYALVGPLKVASNVASGRLGAWSGIRAVQTLFRPGPTDEIAGALRQVGIADKIWERTDRLSGGQQQRTAIARALFQKPDLLLADEPVSALDPARSDSVMNVLTEPIMFSSTKAVVTSMHDAPLALRHCDRIVGLRSGRIQFDLPASHVSAELLDELYQLDDSQ